MKETTVLEIRRDTVITTERDEAMLQALLECDSAGNVLLRKLDLAQGKLNAKIEGVQLIPMPGGKWDFRAKFIADSLKLRAELRDKTHTITHTITNTVLVPADINWWQMTLMWVGGISIITITIALVLGIKNYKQWKKE